MLSWRRKAATRSPASISPGLSEAIARLQPKVIAVDLLLVDKGADDGDEALAKSLAERPTVIAAAAVFPKASQSVFAENDEGPLALLPRAEKFLLPLKKFADHAQIGVANVATDQTGTPRAIPMLFRTSDRIEMSFPLRVAALAIGKRTRHRAKPSDSRSTIGSHRCRSRSFDNILRSPPDHPND